MAQSEILLADAIEALREQLQQAIKAGDGKDVRFQVQDLELELQTVVTREDTKGGKGKAGIKFWLVSAGAEAGWEKKAGSSSLQRIKLKLRPVKKPNGDADSEYDDVVLNAAGG